MKLLAAVGLLSMLIGAAHADEFLHPMAYYERKFYDWMLVHKVEFASGEQFASALRNFAIADDLISAHNEDSTKTYKLAHNEFSHLTWDEFKEQRGIGVPLLKSNSPKNYMKEALRGVRLAESIDWTEKGGVTNVKDQGACGSCWAFSATGALEGAYFVSTGDLQSFSEQELVDCDQVDLGCNGGLMDNAFDFIKTNHGLCTEAAYPYSAQDSSCNKWSCDSVKGSSVKSWVDVEPTESALMQAVNRQPVAIAIEADQFSFQFYSSGVFTGSCGTNLDHGVLLVGYGSEDGQDYWKVKNSWGESWGQNGFILLGKNVEQEGGQCGLLLQSSYPVLE
jgi:C1A family cysteine protease|uniref:Peptidase C1A papain C-terminal domain-containing protein n=1 Tax=Fibrocapsa japonica TaxID=94617 RepID=A0A7S2XZA5_9STRA|mmetsp:Transcript_24201/g.35190  ORF Transcript_24201/g.35190 Transcript_24201/m.35190 type:complete len:336 (+) Transcript_24201:117-1124(+)|eukprot:CAMPEP_0113943764 /NCGR_PEP_ID=MMETSP1339-20121228/27451_1 /TAXON_ID=94617 /ORGANISM="Fibrocapsa japonica" /LENGTH=335 /DNA_ID=CAMNT_0000948715 /DNA_START=95 /DNA_END=1102 /DNA_ORIENTATION=- /assembly_acc=CAM_ASM_000762